jgi:hypothetical protein
MRRGKRDTPRSGALVLPRLGYVSIAEFLSQRYSIVIVAIIGKFSDHEVESLSHQENVPAIGLGKTHSSFIPRPQHVFCDGQGWRESSRRSKEKRKPEENPEKT